MPSSISYELVGLRLGERLTLPDNAILSTMLKNSTAKVNAVVRLSEGANNIDQNEYTMKSYRGQEAMRMTGNFRFEDDHPATPSLFST